MSDGFPYAAHRAEGGITLLLGKPFRAEFINIESQGLKYIFHFSVRCLHGLLAVEPRFQVFAGEMPYIAGAVQTATHIGALSDWPVLTA